MAKTNSPEIENMIKCLSKVPGLGARSARRGALALLQKKEGNLKNLIEALKVAYDKITTCPTCGNLDTQSPCSICNDATRDYTKLVIVETVSDLWAFERSSSFSFYYHVLGGVLSPINGVGPNDLNFNSLISRIQNENINEIIIALNATIDSQTTAHYISSVINESKPDIKITRLAFGIPMGGELDFLDDNTLIAAINDRQALDR